jgi:hypothetical protein
MASFVRYLRMITTEKKIHTSAAPTFEVDLDDCISATGDAMTKWAT